MNQNQNLNNWYSIEKQASKKRAAKSFLSLPTVEEKLDYSNEIELLTNEFVDEAKVYTSITNINIEDSRLIITFGNGLIFDCGIVKGEKIILRKTSLGIEYKYESEADEQYKILVPINDILYKFENLTDEQKDQLKFHFSDFTEEEIKLLQQPALDVVEIASDIIEEAKTQIKNISDLTTNIDLLNKKISEAEDLRESKEATRQNNDKDREKRTNVAIENVNKVIGQAEIAIKNADTATGKANTEANRAKLLADHPSKIIDKIWYVYEESVNDYVNTNIIAEGKNGKSPEIRDGVWWKYNDELGDYENTHIAVNSDYELTKDKIETVFTGDISSHNHDSMYYTETEVDNLLAAVQPKINVIDNLVSNSTTEPLSANQGKILNESKVDKITGKGLSTEDYTTEDKNKLANIAAGAEVNVNADWNATEGDSQILNKPTIPSKTSEIIKDDVYTKTEINTSLNLKVDKSLVGTSNGLAQLDDTGKVPTAQLPFLPDDLLSLGETVDKAYPGDKGKKNADDITKINNKLSGIEEGAQVNEINSVAGRKGDIILTKADVNLENVENTSDLDKPVSRATQIELDKKLDIVAYTANDVLTKIKTVDGADSGLDADLLDGKHGVEFALKNELPVPATAEKAGLMAPEQVQKLENLNSSYLSNKVTGKKVEYTDAGKLLFEGKEAFAVDADNELTLAGKKLSELGSNVNIISIPLSIMNLSPSSSSDEIFTAWGGQQAMLDFVKNFSDSNVYGIYLKDGEVKMVAYPSVQIEYKDDANYSIIIVIPSASGSMSVVFEITAGIASFSSVMPPTYVENSTNIHNTGDYIYLMYGKLNDSENDRRDIIFCNTADYQAVSAEPKHLAYSGSKSIRLENTGDGTKALMDDGTYKEITSGNTLGLDITPLLTGLVDPSQSFVITQEMFDSIVEAYTNRYQMAYVVVEGESAYFTMNISYNTANPRFFYDVSLFAPIAWGGAIGYCDYNIITFEVYEDDKSTTFNNCNIRLYSNGIGNRFLSDDGGYKEITVATISANGLLRQLNGSTTSFMRGDGTWATPPDTTYSPATQSANGLMSADDKKKLDRIGSKTTATTVANLDVNYETILVTLSANASLSANLTGASYDTWETHVFVQASGGDRTITIPTTGNYISMCGSNYTCPSGKWVEFNLKCIGGIWHIAKLEQE